MNSKSTILLVLLLLFIGLLFAGCVKDFKKLFGNGKGSTETPIPPIEDSGQGELQSGFDKPFGIYGASKEYSELGADFSRFDLKWGDIEPEKGTFDWSLADSRVNALGDNLIGLATIKPVSSWGANQCCKIVNGKCNCSGVNAPENFCSNTPTSTAIDSSCTPNDMEEFKEFVKQAVTRYKDKIKYWQIGNEVYNAPGFYWRGTYGGYVQTLHAGYDAIKSVDSEAKVVNAGLALHDIDFIVGQNQPIDKWEQQITKTLQNSDPRDLENFKNIKTFLETEKNYFDVLDVHLYYNYNQIPARLKYLKEKMKSEGYEKEIISTENNIDYGKTYNGDSSIVARELVKRFTLNFANGAKKAFFFAIRGPKPTGKETLTKNGTNWGLTNYDGTKNPAYYTYKLMTEKLNGFESVQKLDSGKYVYNFPGGRKVFILWSDNGDKTISLGDEFGTKTPRTITHIITEEGKTEPQAETAEVTSIPITIDPIFVE